MSAEPRQTTHADAWATWQNQVEGHVNLIDAIDDIVTELQRTQR